MCYITEQSADGRHHLVLLRKEYSCCYV